VGENSTGTTKILPKQPNQKEKEKEEEKKFWGLTSLQKEATSTHKSGNGGEGREDEVKGKVFPQEIRRLEKEELALGEVSDAAKIHPVHKDVRIIHWLDCQGDERNGSAKVGQR